jgi:hypothetical protein
MSLTLNVGGWDRKLRLVLGIALLALAWFGVLKGWAAAAAYVVAVIAVITGVVGYCPANSILGINTRRQ